MKTVILCSVISLLLLAGKGFSQTDSATISQTVSISIPKQHQFLLYGSAGVSVYDKLNIIYYQNVGLTPRLDDTVKGKACPVYSLGFLYRFKGFNAGLSATRLQSRFTGGKFNAIAVFDYYNKIFDIYDVYQDVTLNTYQVALNAGYSKTIYRKHSLSIIGGMQINVYNNQVATNHYVPGYQRADVTKYEPLEHQKMKGPSYNGSKSLSLKVGYDYLLTKKIMAGISFTAQRYFRYRIKEHNPPDDGGVFKGLSNNGYLNAYNLQKQSSVYAQLKLTYLLN